VQPNTEQKKSSIEIEINKQLQKIVEKTGGNLDEYQQVFNLLYADYADKDFDTLSKEKCVYLETMQSKQQYIDKMNNEIKSQEKQITIEVKTDKKVILRQIDRAIALASIQTYCPSIFEKLKQLKK
jgi:hypothetical protein